MGQNDFILLAVFVIVVAAVTFLALAPTHVEFGTLAEWAGAVATTAAVVVALRTAGHSQRQEAARLSALARVTAFRLAPNLVMIFGETARAMGIVQEAQQYGLPPVEPILSQKLATLAISTSIPPDVFADTWTLPPHIALSVAQLESRLLAHAQLTQRLQYSDLVTGSSTREDVCNVLRVSLNSIHRLATEILEYSGDVSDAIVHARREA